MPEVDPEHWGAKDIVFPRLYQCGNFRPVRCCLCGGELGRVWFPYAEGPLCESCDFPVHCRASRSEAAFEPAAGGC